MQGGSHLFQQDSNLQQPLIRLQLAITNIQSNIPVVFHLPDKDWVPLEAQIRAEFCVIFILFFQVLTQQWRVTQIQNDYFFQVNLADILHLGTGPTSVELFHTSGSVGQEHLAFGYKLK